MISRREFLLGSSSSLLALSGARRGAALAGHEGSPARLPERLRTGAAHDLILRNGIVYDGLGSPARVLDVGISNGRIAELAPRIAARGNEEIDASDFAVAPGFIDIHSHADSALAEDPRAESVIRQGITTIVAGADGSSRATGASNSTFLTLFARLDALQPACNVASMVGLGSVRGAVVGNADRKATAAELGRMQAHVAQALAQGACGASTGLEYTPGAFASEAELIALCTPLRAAGKVYATHMRNEDDRLLAAIDEALAVAKGAGCRLQISHLKAQGPRNWGVLGEALSRIEAAHASGMDVAFDRYPYLAYATGLTSLFPVWSRDGGTDALLRRLGDATSREKIRDATLEKIALLGGWDNVQITSVSAASDRSAEGMRLGTYASGTGEDPFDATVALLKRSGGNVGMVGFAMSEANLERLLAHPLCMVCTDGGGFATDGPTRRGSPHPRGIGSFPLVLGRYVRDRKVLSMESAIQKLSQLPASRAGLRDRGQITTGFAADLVVFDPARIADRATFAQPFQYPDGIRLVVVNGRVALQEGVRTAVRSGRALRVI